MGWPLIEVGENGRCKLAKTTSVLNVITIPFCIILFITGIYIQVAIRDKVSLIDGLNGEVLPGFMIAVGLLGLLSCAFGAKVSWANSKPSKRKYWSKYLFPYVCVALFVFLCILVSAIVSFAQISTLRDSFGKGIRKAMTKYKSNPVEKSQMDDLQIEFECCGSDSYTDWFGVSWIHEEYLSEEKKNAAKKKSTSGEFMNDDVPFSCCSPDVLRPCIHHHVHDNSQHYNYDYRSKVTLFTKGCKEALTDFYGKKILTEVGAVVFFISFVQLVLVIISRIVQTAIDDSMNADDPEDLSTAHIFPFGRRAIKSVAKGIKKYHKGGSKSKLPLLDEHGHEISEDELSDKDLHTPTQNKTELDTDDMSNFSSFDDDFDDMEEPLYENLEPNINTATTYQRKENSYVAMPAMPQPSMMGSVQIQPHPSNGSGIYDTINSRGMLRSRTSVSMPDYPAPVQPVHSIPSVPMAPPIMAGMPPPAPPPPPPFPPGNGLPPGSKRSLPFHN